MSIFEIVLISIGLAMDAFGVSIGKGLTMPVGENGRKVTLAFLFGLFQFLMPLIGWLIGCLLSTSPSPRAGLLTRMPSSA